MINHIFVYGTLKSNETNYYIIESMNLKKVDDVKTVEKYQMYRNKFGTFPYLLDKKGNFNITGELYEITSDRQLEEFDQFEGVPTLYYRDVIKVKNDSDKIYEAYVYFKTDPYEYSDVDKTEMLEEW